MATRQQIPLIDASASLAVTGTVTITGSGSAVITFPSTTDTLVGKATTDTLTNKDLTSGTNTFPTLNQNTTGSAATLTTSRTFQTDLASTTAASFDGSANNSHGVTGNLPVNHGGTGRATATTAYGLIAAGTTATGAQQTISPGTSGQFLKSAGASALAAFASITSADISDLGSSTVTFTNKDLTSSTNTIDHMNVARQNNTTNSTVTGARIETGWGWIQGTGAARLTEAVTFGTAFTTAPIVTLCYGGDQNGTTPSYGSGGLNVRASIAAYPYSITTTGFTALVQTVDATTWSTSQGVYYHWIAIGL